MKGVWRKIKIVRYRCVLSETSKTLYRQQKNKRFYISIFVLITMFLDMSFGAILVVTITASIFFPNSIILFLNIENPDIEQVLGTVFLASAIYFLLRALVSKVIVLRPLSEMELLQIQTKTQTKLKALTDA